MNMLNKLVGCNLTLVSTTLCFVLFKLLIHHEYDSALLKSGIFFVILYSVPFILLAGVVSFIFDKIKLKMSKIVFHFLVALIIASIVLIIFHFTSMDLIFYVITTCLIGGFVFQCSYFIQNNMANYIIGIGIPLGVVLFLYIV